MVRFTMSQQKAHYSKVIHQHNVFWDFIHCLFLRLLRLSPFLPFERPPELGPPVLSPRPEHRRLSYFIHSRTWYMSSPCSDVVRHPERKVRAGVSRQPDHAKHILCGTLLVLPQDPPGPLPGSQAHWCFKSFVRLETPTLAYNSVWSSWPWNIK